MKRNNIDNIKTTIILVIVILLVKQTVIIPWWSFVIPVLGLGFIISLKRWQVSSFAIGFLAGFVVWFGANLYYDMVFAGNTLAKVGLVLFVPKIIVMMISGVMGGLLTGLALYTGKMLPAYDQVAELEKKVW